MKVLCINNGNINGMICPELVEGNIYTASKGSYTTTYQVFEMPTDPADGVATEYLKIRFIPTSSIDEKEFERNYIKETV